MSSIIAHLTVGTSDFEKAKLFYENVLSCLEYSITFEIDGLVGFGAKKEGDSSFWVSAYSPLSKDLHYCFIAPRRQAVDNFHTKALEFGGKDNGKPGIRKYQPNYYAAYIIDPDGHRIEALCLD